MSLAALFAAGPAQAVVTTTNVTTPSSPYFNYYDGDATTNTFTVAGTSDGTTGDSVDVYCTYDGSYSTVAQDVPVNANGTWSTDAADKPSEYACVLRALPNGTTYSSTNGYDGTHYTGPRTGWGYTYTSLDTSDAANPFLYYYYVGSSTFEADNEITPAGYCGLEYNYLYDSSFDYYTGTWDCNAYFYAYDATVDGSLIRVDGHNGYDPYTAYGINSSAPGLPKMSVDRKFDAATGQWTITETDPIAFCANADNSINDTDNPSSSDCVKFVSSGVTLVRTIKETQNAKVVSISDAWTSTDGAQHALNAYYGNYQNSTSTKLPGEDAYTYHYAGPYDLGSASTGSIYFQTDASNSPGLNNLQGALSWTTAPTRAIFEDGYYFLLQYDRTIPAGGNVTIPQTYSQSFSREAIQSSAQSAEDGGAAPVVKITSPANGAVVNTDSVTVVGTATDNVGVKKLTVNGIPTPVEADGSWSQRVPLSPGNNAVVAIATDGAGQSSQAGVFVIYAPPAAPSCKVPNVVGQTAQAAATALGNAGCTVGVTTSVPSKVAKGKIAKQSRKVGATLPAYFPIDLKVSSGPVGKAKLRSSTVRIKKGSVSLKLECPKTSGNVCNGTVKLRTRGKVAGKKRTLGTKAFQTPAGRKRTTTIKLSKANRKALAGKTTKVDVYIVFRDEDGKSRTTKDSLKIKG